MLKMLAKSTLVQIGSRLPSGARRSFLQGLARSGDYETFQELGRALGVKDLAVSGEFGLIEGSIDDRVQLPVYARTKTWSPMKRKFFTGLFERGDGGTYIDVGANIGLTTIPIARNPKVSCKAFEPEPSSFRYLERNVAANCPGGNVELFNCALLDRKTALGLELSEANLADHRVRFRGGEGQMGEQDRKTIEIEATRLDDVADIRGLRQPVAAKITAQGSECHVTEGGRAVLAAAEAMVIQLYPYLLSRAGADTERLADFLVGHFASAAMIVGDQDEPLDWVPIGTMATRIAEMMGRLSEAPYNYYHVFVRK